MTPSPGGSLPEGLWRLILERLWPRRDRGAADVWIQGVSVGETELSVALARELRSLRPELPLLLTSTTPAGVGLLGRRGAELSGPLRLRPFPLDLPFSVRRFFDAARPRLLVLVETELWPGVLWEARRRGIPVLLVNARLSPRSARRYRALGPLFSRSLGALAAVRARSDEDARRFVQIGVPLARVETGGDLKLDRPEAPEPAFAEEFRRLSGSRPVLVAGSLADEEVDVALGVRERLLSTGVDIFLLLAPRRPESWEAVARRLSAAGLRFARRSRLDGDVAADRPDAFLLDTLGELAGSYRLGDVALLGGTFAPKGGHNVLEPLRAGLPTLCGPSVWNIRAALDETAGAVFPAADAASAAAEVRRLLSDPAARRVARQAALRIFARSSGATRAAAEHALELLDGRPGA